jgi:hypothetical protein
MHPFAQRGSGARKDYPQRSTVGNLDFPLLVGVGPIAKMLIKVGQENNVSH